MILLNHGCFNIFIWSNILCFFLMFLVIYLSFIHVHVEVMMNFTIKFGKLHKKEKNVLIKHKNQSYKCDRYQIRWDIDGKYLERKEKIGWNKSSPRDKQGGGTILEEQKRAFRFRGRDKGSKWESEILGKRVFKKERVIKSVM